MILISKANFGFMHIPKCAGSTFREQLQNLNETGRGWSGIIDVPGHGRMYGHHLPLSVVSDAFPEIMERLCKVTRYAVVREPMERFRSSMSQWIRNELRREASEMSAPEILDECMKVIDELSRGSRPQNPRLGLFLRQSDFVFFEGRKFVENLYCFNDIDRLARDIQERHGLHVTTESVWNQTLTYKAPGWSARIKQLRSVAKRHLPTRSYAFIRDLGVKVFTTKGAPGLAEAFGSSDTVGDFVRSHYAQDLDLFASVNSANAAA